MATTAPYSSYRKNTFKLGIVLCIAFSIWFAYDGYYNEEFIEKHTVTEEEAENTGKSVGPDDTLKFHRIAPFILPPAAVVLAFIFMSAKKRNIVAEDDKLVIDNGKQVIPYESISKIDKTNYDKKGFFIVTYDADGNQKDIKISYKSYDNLDEILEVLIAKIS